MFETRRHFSIFLVLVDLYLLPHALDWFCHPCESVCFAGWELQRGAGTAEHPGRSLHQYRVLPKTLQKGSVRVGVTLSLSASLPTHTKMAFVGLQVRIKYFRLTNINIWNCFGFGLVFAILISLPKLQTTLR